MPTTLTYTTTHRIPRTVSLEAFGVANANANRSAGTPGFVSSETTLEVNPPAEGVDIRITLPIPAGNLSASAEDEILTQLRDHIGPNTTQV